MELNNLQSAAFHRLLLAALAERAPSKRLVKALNSVLDTTDHVLSTKRLREREESNA